MSRYERSREADSRSAEVGDTESILFAKHFVGCHGEGTRTRRSTDFGRLT